MDVTGKRVLVVGLARSGLAMAQALARRGAVTTVSDRKPPSEFRDVLPPLLAAKVGLELGSQSTEVFLRHEVIVVSPGVPWDLPQLEAARARGIPVYPEVEAATWFLDGTLIGITGSNGKTTTTALLGDILRASGFPTFVGGNIGNALSSAVDHTQPGTMFVTELSSFQLEGTRDFDPHVAVMLNLSPNHLDRHPSLEAYAQAKRRIFRNQRPQDYAILNADDPWVAGLQGTVASRPVLFSRRRELPAGISISGGKIYYRVRHMERALFDRGDVKLRGDFNLEDVLAATAVACVLGADFAAIRKAVRAFQAVEHRLEFVREIQGVDYYNNSKATSVDATLKSLEAFPRGIHLIMGGKDKGAPYTPLIPLLQERVREVLLIGAAAPVINEQLAGSAELVQAGDLATAVYEAFSRSRPGDTVLLAPACSSFDQFKDYEERGRAFKELVAQLAKHVEIGAVMRGMRFVTPPRAQPAAPAENAGGAVESQSTGERLEFAPTAAGAAAVPQDSDQPETGAAGAPPDSEPSEVDTSAAVPQDADRQETAGSAVSGQDSGRSEGDSDQRESGSSAAALQGASRIPLEAVPPPAPATPEVESATEKPETPEAETSPETPTEILASSGTDTGDSRATEVSTVPVETAPAVPAPVVGPVPETDPTPVSAVAGPSPEREVPSPELCLPSAPHRLELTYVYEVDAAELPGMESQVVPEDEPAIVISPGSAETLDDEVLPFEVRTAESGVRGPESGVEGKSGVRTTESRVKRKAKVRGPRSKGQKTLSGVRGPASGTQKTSSDVQGPEPGVEGESQVRGPESEVPKASPDVQSPASEVQSTTSEGEPTSQQPKLFNGDDK